MIGTSRHNTPFAVYGRYGIFLASVAALSILTITSHHQSTGALSTLILHQSRSAARLIPAPSHQQLSGHGYGTRVTVQDLFGNMPVRVKQRAAIHLGNDKTDVREFEALKSRTIALLLSWHRPVSLTLANVHRQSEKLRIRMNEKFGIQETHENMHTGLGEISNSAGIRPVKSSLICSTLSQAGYIEPRDSNSWIKTSARTSRVAADGVISLDAAPSKHIQFISLGIRPILFEDSGNVVYDEINRLFAASKFGNSEDFDELEHDKGAKDKRHKQDGFTNKQLKGGGRGVDRWPMFYIRIELRENAQSQSLERQDVLSDVLKVVRAMILEFLKANHFRPFARLKGPRQRQRFTGHFVSPHSASRMRDPFCSWSRIKSGRQSTTRSGSPSCHPWKMESTNTEKNTRLPSAQISEAHLGPVTTKHSPKTVDNNEQMFEWVNPVSKAKVLINSRTGTVVAEPLLRRPSTAPSSLQSSLHPLTYKLSRRLSTPCGLPKPGSWADGLLANWENPVFPLAEEAIPQVPRAGAHLEISDAHDRQRHHCSNIDTQAALTLSATTDLSRISKSALATARIISQVDKKFILISMSNETKALVLVDQHAADERIRVEALVEQLSTQPPSTLAKSMIFEISSRDQEPLAKHLSFFARWGIKYSISWETDLQKGKVVVNALPQAIAERCRVEPKVLIELLRGEAWKLEDKSTIAHTNTPPQALLNMLTSRACRSAVMFNDVLSIAEAETMISRLAQTNLPFQCAHGRPSMVPLLDLGEAVDPVSEELAFGLDGGEKRKAEEGFGISWKRWRGGC